MPSTVSYMPMLGRRPQRNFWRQTLRGVKTFQLSSVFVAIDEHAMIGTGQVLGTNRLQGLRPTTGLGMASNATHGYIYAPTPRA